MSIRPTWRSRQKGPKSPGCGSFVSSLTDDPDVGANRGGQRILSRHKRMVAEESRAPLRRASLPLFDSDEGFKRADSDDDLSGRWNRAEHCADVCHDTVKDEVVCVPVVNETDKSAATKKALETSIQRPIRIGVVVCIGRLQELARECINVRVSQRR